MKPVTIQATLTNGQKLTSVQDKDALARAKPWERSLSIKKACMTMPDVESAALDDFVTDLILLAVIAERNGRDILKGTMLADYAFVDGDHLTNEA